MYKTKHIYSISPSTQKPSTIRMTVFVPNVKSNRPIATCTGVTAMTTLLRAHCRNWISVTLPASRSNIPSTTSSRICKLMRIATSRTAPSSHRIFIFAVLAHIWNASMLSTCSVCATIVLLCSAPSDLTPLCVWNSLVIRALRPRSVRPSNMSFPNINKPPMKIARLEGSHDVYFISFSKHHTHGHAPWLWCLRRY